MIVALGALAAETEDQAQYLLSSARLFRRRIRQGVLGPIPSPEEALRELSSAPRSIPENSSEWPRYFVGTPARVQGELVEMASDLKIDEIMIVTIAHDYAARLRSYQLLAEAFDLRAEVTPSQGQPAPVSA